MTTSNCFHNLMQKFQAYLKMITSTFKEQPLRNSSTTWRFLRTVCSILPYTINIYRQWLWNQPKRNENTMSKNQPKWNISEKPNRFLSKFRFEHLCSSADKCSNPDHPNWHHIVQTSENLNFSSTLEMHKFLHKTYSMWPGPALSRCNRCSCIGPRASGVPRHSVWVDYSFLPDTPCAWEFSRNAI